MHTDAVIRCCKAINIRIEETKKLLIPPSPDAPPPPITAVLVTMLINQAIILEAFYQLLSDGSEQIIYPPSH